MQVYNPSDLRTCPECYAEVRSENINDHNQWHGNTRMITMTGKTSALSLVED